ncbi:MAG: hypothetical protein ACREAK_06155 [Nitrosarchaeum sp.]
MDKLPGKFPEYLIMYKTLTKKISDLKNEAKLQNSELEKIQNKIKKYELERTKIMNMFPENFFNNYPER